MEEKRTIIAENKPLPISFYFYVAAGGFVGTVIRAIFFTIISSLFVVFIVNIAGSFFIGILMYSQKENKKQLFFGTGLLGALTTFSAFMMVPFSMIEPISFETALNSLVWIFTYAAVMIFGGILAAFLGKLFAEAAKKEGEKRDV